VLKDNSEAALDNESLKLALTTIYASCTIVFVGLANDAKAITIAITIAGRRWFFS